jgi:hypothetical protein
MADIIIYYSQLYVIINVQTNGQDKKQKLWLHYAGFRKSLYGRIVTT